MFLDFPGILFMNVGENDMNMMGNSEEEDEKRDK
jgi:hypothetical protein